MWTYLVIFFSLAALAGVFAWRAVAYAKFTAGKNKVIFRKNEVSEMNGSKPSGLSKKTIAQTEELYKKGESALKSGSEDRAIKYFVQALALDEFHVDTLQKLAILYMQKQMHGAAAALFKNLGKLTGDAVHYSHLGLALYQQGLFEEARDAYQKAIKLDPSRPQRFVSLAQVYRSLGQLNNSLIAMNKALDADSENIDYMLFIADVQVELKNYEESEKVAARIIEIDPDNADAKKCLKAIKKLIAEA
ncbi:MAG: tetratricopeptide repeat protein [Candidatus Peregrinibacteria bacterium]